MGGANVEWAADLWLINQIHKVKNCCNGWKYRKRIYKHNGSCRIKGRVSKHTHPVTAMERWNVYGAACDD